jgi:uncharacterized protein (DUF1015 family)
VTTSSPAPSSLELRPFRAVRPAVDPERLGLTLCPPYDVIDASERERLAKQDPLNAVRIVLPEADGGRSPYEEAAKLLQDWVANRSYRVDETPALYVYEMETPDGHRTRGLFGAVGLRDPAEGVILPHENTMAGPVADRLALMTATLANVEPIYLVYDGGGDASEAVAAAGDSAPLAEAATPDGVRHRLWAITDSTAQARIADDLHDRRALIADGHHRYATYRELQARLQTASGAGPWDYGLTLLVDSSTYGPQVHAIHRVVAGLTMESALDRLSKWADVEPVSDGADALRRAADVDGFAAVVAERGRAVLVADRSGNLRERTHHAVREAELADLDVTVVHRTLVPEVWRLSDDEATVRYAHSPDEALDLAADSDGVAVLLRPTPVAAVAAVAAAGLRMPRKSTLFTPKPASGMVMRRFADES